MVNENYAPWDPRRYSTAPGSKPPPYAPSYGYVPPKPRSNMRTGVSTSRDVMPPITGANSFTGAGGTRYNTQPRLPTRYTPHTNSFTGIPGTQNPLANAKGVQPNTFGKVSTFGTPSSASTLPATVADPIEEALKAMLGNAGAISLPPVGSPSYPEVGPINVPELARTDISGLLGQFSPMINQAYDTLTGEIQNRKGEQERSLGQVMNRVRASYAPARADVNAGTQAAGNQLSEFANRLGLSGALSGGMNQRWAESAGRLNNLATQNEAAQTGALETLQNARNSQFGTMLASAQGGRASALANLASQLASSQSDIDLARAQNQGELSRAALSGQLDLTKLRSDLANQNVDRQFSLAKANADLQGQGFDRQLQVLKLLSDIQNEKAKREAAANEVFIPDVTQTQTMNNQGLQQALGGITDPAVKKLIQNALSTTTSVDEAYRQLYGKQLTQSPIQPVKTASAPGGIKGLVGMIGSLGQLNPTSSSFQSMLDQRDALADALAFLQSYAPSYGGISTSTELKRKTPS